MRRRTFLVLSGSAALAACTGAEYAQPLPYPGGPLPPPMPGQPLPGFAGGGRGRAVALLSPLTGPRADIGQALLQAAQLALAEPGSPPLIPADTASTQAGAANAVRAAIGEGAGIVLGPLTAADTEAVAPIANAAGLPVLAFTNTPTAARPGVWTLGITPAQQVNRLVSYAQAQGRSKFAAFLPESDFGHALGEALAASLARNGLSPVAIRYHGSGMAAISAGLKEISNYEGRWGPIQKQIRELKAERTPEARREAERLTRTQIPPPPFDVLLLGDIGDQLAEIASVLSYYFITAPAVQVMGPALWATPASGARALQGALYAAPDSSARESFAQAFVAKTGSPPPGPADLAFDAANIARQTAPTGFAPGALTNPSGFSGVDGWLRLMPDGQVQRALAIYRIESGGPQLVSAPAPGTGV